MTALDPGVSKKLLEGTVGELLLRPWFDRAALWFLVPWYFPLSRMWAAGLASDGSVADFRQQTGINRLPNPVIATALMALSKQRERLGRADGRWHQGFFQGHGPTTGLAALEASRRDEAHKLMAARTLFLPLKVTGMVRPLRLDIAPPADVRVPVTAYRPPSGMPEIAESRSCQSGGNRISWLRFQSPAADGGTVWARVVTPPGYRPGGPTLVHAHGVCVESEFWPVSADRLDALIDNGTRVVFPEGPGHGRRRWPGWFGGEQVLGRGPSGLLDYFDTLIQEMAALIQWARQSSDGGQVAVGGVSLGALTAQLLLGACTDWPADLKPDAALLVVPGRSVLKVAFEGSLTGALGVPEALKQTGWTTEALQPWRTVLEPAPQPGIDAARIVVALGTEDDVTLYEEGISLVRSWDLPAGNIFSWRRGHFSTALGLARDAEPLHRLHDLLANA